MASTRLVAYLSAGALSLFFLARPDMALAACAAPTPGATLTAPDQLLSRFPAGEGAMVSEVRNLVATNPANLDAITGLVVRATPAQKRAIGAGLGQAAGLCARPDPDAARRIQEAVIRLDDREMLLAFQVVTGDRATAAAAGPGGGAGGGQGGSGVAVGLGGGTGAGSSGFFGDATSVVANNASGYAAGGGSGVSLRPARSSGGTTFAPSPFVSVSPGN